MNLQNFIESLKSLKEDGVPKDEALDCLEFHSDEYPDPKLLNQALEIVYGK